MVGWHHQLKEHEFEQTLGDSEGQEILACCAPSKCLNNNNNGMYSAGKAVNNNIIPLRR